MPTREGTQIVIFMRAPEMPAGAWLEAIRVRRSRRTYDGRPIEPDKLEHLTRFCETTPIPDIRMVVVREAPPEIFLGIGSYGAIRNAPSAVVFVGPAHGAHVPEQVGYASGAVLLEATRLGLATCWVGGAFRPRTTGRHAGLRAGEKVWGVTPVGTAEETVSGMERIVYGMKQATPKPRKPIEEIAPGVDAHAPEWVHSGIAAARLAPSAYNRQPWRFQYENGRVKLAVEGPDTPKVSKRIDCGIAMLHFEVGARFADAPGRWELHASGPHIALYALD